MTKEKHKVAATMFDIKPVDGSGSVDVSKISNLQPVLNLGRKFRMNKNGGLVSNIKYPVVKKKKALNDKKIKSPIEEFEAFLNKESDTKIELASIGAEFHGGKYSKPRYYPIFSSQKSEISNEIPNSKFQKEEVRDDYEAILQQINKRITPSVDYNFTGEAKKIDAFSLGLLTFKMPQEAQSSHELDRRLDDFSKKTKTSKSNRVWFLIAGLGLIAFTVFGHYGSALKNQLITESNSAVANLQTAGENIKNMDFVSASGNFSEAYREFSKAGDNLNFMGAGISSLLSDLPGFDKLTAGGAGKLKSAKNLTEAGKLMANAGQAMSDAMGEIAKTNLILLPTSQVGNSAISIGEISSSLKKALTLSRNNLGKAGQLLADIDDSSIPENKKTIFEEFKLKLPLFEKLINDSVDYSKFLEDFTGIRGIKRYLVLFQNPSELRPTGGFPGTYGVITFKDGKLQDFKVDDVYNLDGQLQELIVPPLQLQHITPNWGMRDANWFVDFPTSARKVTEFYEKITSPTCSFTSRTCKKVDGVITFSPQIVAHILDIVGPVEMPDYNLTLNSNNLFSTLQEEVEYKGDRKQPKQIIVDLAPLMLQKLYLADSGKWLDVFNLLISSMEQKDILMYFRDLNLQSFSMDKGFSGQVKNTGSDYLMVTFTNVKGSKTDLVMDSSLKVETTIEDGSVKHRISIIRTHNGGNSEYGFYNKQSPTYVRVLVPDNSEFTGLTGNSRPEFKPLIDYTNSEFKKDEDLAVFEEGSYTDKETGVTIYKEAGKTEYGFWMIINSISKNNPAWTSMILNSTWTARSTMMDVWIKI
ncbi:MAG: DUF4012 domain-containing protein [Candidatus Yanofskybacteria bacterium]|nr:DUF4012 domain-containing protein [Candidatus Yanofskybacteria bacterium]